MQNAIPLFASAALAMNEVASWLTMDSSGNLSAQGQQQDGDQFLRRHDDLFNPSITPVPARSMRPAFADAWIARLLVLRHA